MSLQTATNPETGETVVLVGNDWQKADKTASNDKGEKAYLVGGKWLTDSQSAPESKPEATVRGVAAEGGKGLLRGASNTAMMIPEGMLRAVLGPMAPAVMSQIERISNRDLVKANPQNEPEKMASTGGEIAGSVLAGGPGASVRQTAVNTLLPTVGGVVGEQIGGETGKTVGALTPTAVQAAAGPLAMKASQAVADRMAPRIAQFKEAGTVPSVGQATELNFLQGFENLLSKFPGGQGIFRKFAENQQAQLGQKARTGVAAEDAGRAIEKGITGEGGFIERTKATWTQLDDKLAAKVGTQYGVPPVNTQAALDALVAPVAGAEKTTGALVNPKIAAIREAFMEDVKGNQGSMPFDALRKLRTKVGSMLDDALVSGVPGGELKKVYGALSKDLEVAAKAVGAGDDFARQSNYYKARMERIEGVLERVIGSTPEETFKRFMPTDPDQVTKVRAVMRSLDPEQKKIVTDAVVNRLGRATPGKQGATGEGFSPETFLTNWNKLSEGAKAQLFSDPTVRKNMDSIAGVTDNLRSGARVFANPSGTAGANAPYGIGFLLGGAGAALATGNVPAAVGMAATVGTVIGGAAVGSKMLTSPNVVEWLARASKLKPGEEAVKHIARLGVIYNSTKDEGLKSELGDYLQSLNSK
jgi:hypothetical protein